MAFQGRIRDVDAECLLTGHSPAGARGAELEELACFVNAVQASVPAQPALGSESSLVQRLAETARSASSATAVETAPMRPVGGGAWRPRLALAARVAVSVALLAAGMAGLAFAGVTLPEPAREAMERIGLDLPNQSAVDEPTTTDSDREGATRSRTDRDRGGESTRRARGRDEGNARAAGKRGKRSERARGDASGRGQGPPSQGESRGEGEPALGEPAPIVPPGQGGTPPGQGGPSPSEGKGQSSEPHGGGASGAKTSGSNLPGAVPPGTGEEVTGQSSNRAWPYSPRL